MSGLGRTLWRMGRAWCLAVVVLLAVSLIVVLLREGRVDLGGGHDGGLGPFALLVVLAPGLLFMLVGGMLGTQRSDAESDKRS